MLGAILVTFAFAATCGAQSKQPSDAGEATAFRTFYLNSGTSVERSREVLTGVRLMLDSRSMVYLMPSDGALLVHATPEQIELASKVISAMNQPRKDYRVTYTVTEMDGGKRIGVQHYTLLMFPGGRTTLKQGSKVPVVTGSIADAHGGTPNTQFTFVDVGINVDATLDEAADGMRLQSKVEDSGVAEDKVISGVNEPLIRQTLLQGTTVLHPGTPTALGSLDVPGSTRHLDVEVLLEPAATPAR